MTQGIFGNSVPGTPLNQTKTSKIVVSTENSTKLDAWNWPNLIQVHNTTKFQQYYPYPLPNSKKEAKNRAFWRSRQLFSMPEMNPMLSEKSKHWPAYKLQNSIKSWKFHSFSRVYVQNGFSWTLLQLWKLRIASTSLRLGILMGT